MKRAVRQAPEPTGAADDHADKAWMQAYAADDLRALDALFDRYAPRFLGMYRHCLRDATAAETLLEATFAEAHRLRHAYRTRTAVRPWLFGLAARLCLDAMSSSERRSNPAAYGCEQLAADDVVRTAVSSLDGLARVVLYLHRYEGMSFSEIAEVLGSSAQAVRTLVFRAYTGLHGRLQPWLEKRGENS